MKQKLITLLNTLAQIETKGDGTMKMAASMHLIQTMIEDCDAQEKQPQENQNKNLN